MAKKKKKDEGLFDDGRMKALEATLTDLTKKFGDGTIVRLGDATNLDIETIPTGSLTTDIALGVGGVPKGRIVEIYGPESSGKTTFCLHIVREAQKRGGLAAFVDMEHALDPKYAAAIGVNVETLYVSQPDTGEQALEITEALVRSGALDVVIVDSVAALVPRAEIEGEMGDSHVGLQARLMSQALRKLSGAIKQSNVTVLFTNQLREKIGVMFGCFHYNSRIVLADGTTEKIGKIVNQKKAVDVLSYDVETGIFEARPIVNWFKNGSAEYFLQFKVDSNEGHGKREFACTPNHLLLGENGYHPAETYQVGDTLTTAVKYYLDPAHEQIVIGSMLGGGSMRYASDHNVQLRIEHGTDQIAYAQWKQNLFRGLVSHQGTNSGEGHRFETIPMYELAELYEMGYQNAKKNPTEELIRRLSPLAIAIWYMDNGTFDDQRRDRASICCTGLTHENRDQLVDWFNQRGIDAVHGLSGHIHFGVSATYKLHEMVAPYIPEIMQHKLIPAMRGQYRPLEIHPCERYHPVQMKILDIYVKPKTPTMQRFDIEVEGNHCYVVDGVVVHNSPETTSGGRALKFYASVRLDIRRIQSIKQGGDIIGNRTRIKVKKNKVAPPFREAEFDIMFYEGGISKTGEIVDLGTDIGLIEKRGAFYRYNDELMGQGRENTKEYLTENPEIADAIEDGIRAHFGLPTLAALPDTDDTE